MTRSQGPQPPPEITHAEYDILSVLWKRGRLERREGDGWIPTEGVNTESVDLEGTPVGVSWLEEETLAYIRRGRLDRATLCLPHCDQERLLVLLRGVGATQVL